MNDFPTTLRVIAAYKAGEDLAERLATAVAVQQSMSEALLKAADEIARLRLTDSEREAIEWCIEQWAGINRSTTLRNLLERVK